jgi:uncharacterized protein YkwD
MNRFHVVLFAVLVLSVMGAVTLVSAEEPLGDYVRTDDGIAVSAQQTDSISPNEADARAIGSQIADKIVTIVNQKRVAAGAAAVTKDDLLTEIALYQSKEMKKYHFFRHEDHLLRDFIGRAAAFGYLQRVWGENIGKGVADTGTVNQIAKKFVNKWMKKPADQANILNTEFTEIGVGVVYGRPGGATSSWIATLDIADPF